MPLHIAWHQRIRRAFFTGLLVLVPAWGTFLILETLFWTLDRWLAGVLGPRVESTLPGLGLASLLLIIVLAGMLTRDLVGHRLWLWVDESIVRIPIVRSIYQTFKSMTDLFTFRERFGQSTVVVFPFPRQGLWAVGFIMGRTPHRVQSRLARRATMVFVPTAIHPFTGYLAFVPHDELVPINLPAEEALKMEFSAGLYRPQGWLAPPGRRVRPGGMAAQ
jgi:uncharacterized membrane protein